MARRSGAVHVATTTRRYKGKLYRTHLLRRTYRQGKQVKHETLGNISHLPEAIVEMIRGALRGEAYVPASQAFEVLRSLPHGHVAAVLGTLRNLGLERLIASRASPLRDRVVAMVVARVIEPDSKLATARALNDQTRVSSLGQALDLGQIDEDDLYEAMDWLLKRQGAIEKKLAQRHLSNGSLVLYDVTSSYYTGRCCPLVAFGHSRDGKKGFPQIVYGLLCNAEGCPVAVEVFEGNTSDAKTLGSQIQKIRKRFGLARVVLVGDRGMITEARLKDEIRPVEGLDWITALRSPAIQRLARERRIERSLFDERGLAEITSPDYPGERLIVCRNPFLAQERSRKREELLAATEKLLDAIVAATRRRQRPLQGKEKIALRVGRTINKYKMAKHFKLTITGEDFSYERDSEKINAEAALDGIYVIRTSVARDAMDAEGAVRAYKGLSVVERAFRCLKTVDLKVRPIHHRLAGRVRAHIFLCMLAYYVEWHMRKALAPMLFDDEDRDLAEELRTSAVAPAQRSPRARHKARTKRADDGLPVHSFRTLLGDLATIARNDVRVPTSDRADFHIVTTPTPLQSKALGLLTVSLTL